MPITQSMKRYFRMLRNATRHPQQRSFIMKTRLNQLLRFKFLKMVYKPYKVNELIFDVLCGNSSPLVSIETVFIQYIHLQKKRQYGFGSRVSKALINQTVVGEVSGGGRGGDGGNWWRLQRKAGVKTSYLFRTFNSDTAETYVKYPQNVSYRQEFS